MISKKVLFFILLIFQLSAHALTFHAFVLSDEIDNNPGDGVCEIPFGMSFCSLRAAIMEANALGGSHTIILSEGTYPLTILGEETNGLAGDLNVNSADISIIGAGAGLSIIDGNNNNRIFHVSNNSLFSLTNLTLTAGRAYTAGNFTGGAISVGGMDAEVIIENVVFEGNSANAGGAVYATTSVDIHINNSQFDGNVTEALGFTNLNGPAIFCNSCDLTIDGSTFVNNNLGGKAIEIHSGHLLMTNSTAVNNEGGGIRTTNSNAIIRFSTFVNDSAQNLSHFSFDDSHVMEVGGSVLFTPAGSFIDNCQSGDKPTSAGYNIVSDSSCEFMATGDNENTDALLSALADYGGATATMLPMTGSPAINLVPSVTCLDASGVTLIHDQRGEVRPNGVACDAGAVEVDLDIIFAAGFE